jgi:hypothetical protein
VARGRWWGEAPADTRRVIEALEWLSAGVTLGRQIRRLVRRSVPRLLDSFLSRLRIRSRRPRDELALRHHSTTPRTPRTP